MWEVTATADDGSTYSYLVNAPRTISTEIVASAAYGRHGQLYRDGVVPHWLGPEYVCEWREVVTAAHL